MAAVVSPYCLVTAWLVLLVAACKVAAGCRTAFHAALVVMGITSVVHHSRLDRWWIHDRWRAMDVVAVLLVVALGLRRGTAAWLLTCAYGAAIFGAIYAGAVPPPQVPWAHATTHVALLIFLLTGRPCRARRPRS